MAAESFPLRINNFNRGNVMSRVFRVARLVFCSFLLCSCGEGADFPAPEDQCGDGVKGGTEACDDGNLTDGTIAATIAHCHDVVMAWFKQEKDAMTAIRSTPMHVETVARLQPAVMAFCKQWPKHATMAIR
jgi:hypothetical protein